MDKETVRIHLLDERRKITYKKKKTKSLQIIENLIPLIENKSNVAIYLNNADEVFTSDYLDYFISNYKVISSSVVDGDDINFYQIKNARELTKGYNNILEPKEDVLIEKGDIEAILVPMVAFDKMCNRMGFGKGYYDRYLSDFEGDIIGLAFAEQEYPHLPISSHDVRMDYVVTDRKIFTKPKL